MERRKVEYWQTERPLGAAMYLLKEIGWFWCGFRPPIESSLRNTGFAQRINHLRKLAWRAATISEQEYRKRWNQPFYWTQVERVRRAIRELLDQNPRELDLLCEPHRTFAGGGKSFRTVLAECYEKSGDRSLCFDAHGSQYVCMERKGHKGRHVDNSGCHWERFNVREVEAAWERQAAEDAREEAAERAAACH